MNIKATIVPHQQGTPEWMQHRARSLNASDLAAALGLSPYLTRADLIERIATGIVPEVDTATQRRFDKGHEVEALARPLAEEVIGEDLYASVFAADVEGLDLPLSASLDGHTLLNEATWEHKQANAALIASLNVGVIPEQYHPQMEQGQMLTGATRTLFTASNGTHESAVHVWYESRPELRAKIIPTWKQLMADVAAYEPTETKVKPVGKTPETLPALHIEVTGMVTASNLAEYKTHALAVFAGINRELVTDSDFANAESTVKWCGDIETRLAAAKQHALSQTASIDDLFKTIDDISAEARRVRLELDKLVKNRKDSIRAEIVADGRNAMADHIAALNKRIGKPLMPAVLVDFANAIKGKRTLDSMRDAVATELARVRIAANEMADTITLNLRAISEAGDFAFLFADVATLALKDPEFVAMAIKNRIADHQAKEAVRLEAERMHIAAEERAKAEAAERVRADAEIAAATAQARAEAHAQAAADAAVKAAQVMQQAAQAVQPQIAEAVADAIDTGTGILRMSAESVKRIDPAIVRQAMTPKPQTPPTMALGEISARLGFNCTSAFLASLGFEATTVKAAKLFHEEDFPAICRALIEHIESVCELQAA